VSDRRRIREQERRIEDLERRVRELEAQPMIPTIVFVPTPAPQPVMPWPYGPVLPSPFEPWAKPVWYVDPAAMPFVTTEVVVGTNLPGH
jgi:hypothetical protein